MFIDMNVTKHGAVGDGQTNNTASIAAAVSELEKQGGGTLYFPPGKYITGTIELKSNMTLWLDSGAVILGSRRVEDYPPITDEKLPGYQNDKGGLSGLITAIGAENITITGSGIIDGRGYYWWENKDQPRPRAIELILCDKITIRGISVINSAVWSIHPMCCCNVTIDGVTIKNPKDSPNTDGINPESCSNVHISNCHIDVGDDCIAIKSGTQRDDFQRFYCCGNITITNCTMINGHGGVVIGSEMSGGIRNVVISNCIFNGTDRGIRIKTRRKRGGIVEDVRVCNIIMTNVFCPITMNGYYQCGEQKDNMSLFTFEKLPVDETTPVMRNIYVSNISARNVSVAAGYLLGIPECPIENVFFDNVVVEMEDNGQPERPVMAFHVAPVNGEGFYCGNVKNATFNNVQISTVYGADFKIENSEQVIVNGVAYAN